MRQVYRRNSFSSRWLLRQQGEAADGVDRGSEKGVGVFERHTQAVRCYGGRKHPGCGQADDG